MPKEFKHKVINTPGRAPTNSELDALCRGGWRIAAACCSWTPNGMYHFVYLEREVDESTPEKRKLRCLCGHGETCEHCQR